MVCDRVAILVQGRVVRQGTIDDLTADQQRYEIVLDAPDAAEIARKALPARFEALPEDAPGALARRVGWRGELATGQLIEIERDRVWVGTSEAREVQPVLDALRANGAIIRSMRPHRPSLEDLFMQAVTDPTTGKTLKPGASNEPRERKTRSTTGETP
jgi:ABC-type multidrug transport system ATPase subunit